MRGDQISGGLRSGNAEDLLFRDIDISNDLMSFYVFRDPKLCIELLEYLLWDRKICMAAKM